jgi:hypothetical protein
MAMTLREAARRAERDVDVHALLAAGVLRRNADGRGARGSSIRGQRKDDAY